MGNLKYILLICLTFNLLAQDATYYMTQTEELEFMQADWMDNYSTNNDISIGTKWFGESDQERYFGDILITNKNLEKMLQGKIKYKAKNPTIAPLLIVLTNNSRYRILLHGSESIIKSVNGEVITKHANFEDVMAKIDIKSTGLLTTSLMKVTTLGLASTKGFDSIIEAQARSRLSKNSLKNTIVEPGQSIQKILFVPAGKIKQKQLLSIPVQNLKRVAYLDLEVNLPSKLN